MAKVPNKIKQGLTVNIYRLKTGKGAPATSVELKKKSGGYKQKVVQGKSVLKSPGSGGPSTINKAKASSISNPKPTSAEPERRKTSDEKIDLKVPYNGVSKKSANNNDTPISGIRKSRYRPPDTFQDDETMLELADSFKVKNKELSKEVAVLEDVLKEKTKENMKMKVDSENQKKMISSLTDLVSDLKEEVYKNTTSSSNVNKPVNELKQDQKIKAGEYIVANKLDLEPQADTRFKKRGGTKKEKTSLSLNAPEKSSIGRFLFQTPKKCGSVNARKLKKKLQTPIIPFDVSKLEDSILDSSYCSVSKKTGSLKYKRVDEGFPVPRVKFSIVTEEKDGTGRDIVKLPCAMRPETLIRQVKKSYCKKMGLDREKMELKLTGSFDANLNVINLLDGNSVNGLEGAIVKAVRVDDERPKDSKEKEVYEIAESDVEEMVMD